MQQRAPLVLDPADFVDVDGFATPPTPKYRPLHALLSVGRLILNKDDTRQVFEVVRAVTRGSIRTLFARIIATPYGRRVVTEPIHLETILGNFPRLRAMAPGTVGRAYVDFMDEAGFTPQGLIDAANEAGVELKDYPDLQPFARAFRHLEVNHDLWHVLTGYGRDPLGEICNLVFTQRQTGNPGLIWIIRTGLAAFKLERWSMPALAAAREAARMGESVDFLLQHDVEAMLERPLAEVRREFGFFRPEIYHSIPDAVKQAVLRPKMKTTQTEREVGRGIVQTA
ncbi:MAG: Coq4 family protein [Parvularculaceae bacterium]|nr:Coq4 family protein [Parvularculaceae bacterium]